MLRAIPALVLLAACATSAPAPAPAPTARPFSMRMYQLVLLRRGPHWSAERTDTVKNLLAGHMANMRRMGAAGKLLIAGPTDVEDGAPMATPVGIFIFDVETKTEAEALVKTDPTIAAGHFAADILPWYGPSGLTYDGRDAELAKIRAELGKP